MSENDRDERGHFRREHGDREFLEAVADREPAETADITGGSGFNTTEPRPAAAEARRRRESH